MWDYFEWEEVLLCGTILSGNCVRDGTLDGPWTLHGPFLSAGVRSPQCGNGERAPKVRRRQNLRIAWGGALGAEWGIVGRKTQRPGPHEKVWVAERRQSGGIRRRND